MTQMLMPFTEKTCRESFGSGMIFGMFLLSAVIIFTTLWTQNQQGVAIQPTQEHETCAEQPEVEFKYVSLLVRNEYPEFDYPEKASILQPPPIDEETLKYYPIR